MAERRILIAVDGSPESDAAVEVGLELAAQRGASVTFLHVALDIAKELFEMDPVRSSTEEQIEAADTVIRDAVNRAQEKGIVAAGEVIGASREEGPLAETADLIVGTAQGAEAELIVVGSRGRGALEGALLGSVSQGVLRSSSVPVVVVGPGTAPVG